MTANQIAWWNIQEQIRSHMQNELNERNKNSITQSLGDESNRISHQKMENDFVLGQQGNAINQQQADTASRRATQDYDIGLKNVKNVETRNKNDYEVGTTGNRIKSKEVANNFIIGSGTVKNQSIRNAQDYALGQLEQESKRRTADAAVLTAGTKLATLTPGQIVIALAAPEAQKVVNKGTAVVEKKIANLSRTISSVDLRKPAVTPKPAKTPIKGQVVSPRPTTPSTSVSSKPKATTPSQKGKQPALKGRVSK